MDWTTAFGTVLTGLVVVFIALILLILLLTLFRNIFGSVGHKEGEKPAPKPVRAPAPAAPAKPAPVILSDDDGEVAAAITAALAVILAEEGAGKTYAVRSIKRVRTGRSAWGTAGLTENVRPF